MPRLTPNEKMLLRQLSRRNIQANDAVALGVTRKSLKVYVCSLRDHGFNIVSSRKSPGDGKFGPAIYSLSPEQSPRVLAYLHELLEGDPHFPKPPMTPAEFMDRMADIAKNQDPASSHGQADNLMVECLDRAGYGRGIEIYEKMTKWYE